MNGPPPKRTAELIRWLSETLELIANDITAGKALSKDLKKAMGFMEALRIDTRPEVKVKARAIDAICVRELAKRREKTHRGWLEQLQNVAAAAADSSADVAAGIDEELLEELGEETRDLRRHWSSRIFRRMCRKLRSMTP